MSAGLRSGEISAGTDRKVSVLVLCRYRSLLQQLSAGLPPRGGKQLDIRFHTIHGSKGLEADYVIIPGLTRGSHGFPSTIADDPVLQLAMPAADTFPLAEERRLLYVALTPARRSVLLLTVAGRESVFLHELVREHKIAVLPSDGTRPQAAQCPSCEQGHLVQRNGRFGAFLGCSRYPDCRHTARITAPPKG